MPGIVEVPKLNQDALTQYGDLLTTECRRRHFDEYLTGLIVADCKIFLGIHDEFADTTEQSCLNRFLITRDSDHGVIPIDNTLVDREGMLLPDAG